MKKKYLVLNFIIIILIFIILFLYLKLFWPEKWPETAQATLGASIIVGIISIFGVILKFIYDNISSETEYHKKISEKMLLKVHTYAEEYYIPMVTYATSSASQLNIILTKDASTQDKEVALFYIIKYFQYREKLLLEKGGQIFLRNFNSELCIQKLISGVVRNLNFTTYQLYKLQKYVTLEDTPFDFSLKIKTDKDLIQIYKSFEKWLEKNNNIKETILYFTCFNELMCYELNSIYMPWYKTNAPQISNECRELCKRDSAPLKS